MCIRDSDAPVLLDEVGVGRQSALGVDRPAAHAVLTGRHDERREARAVLDSNQQQGAALELGGPGVEDGVDGAGEVLGGDDRVGVEASKDFTKIGVVHLHPPIGRV